MTTLGPELVQSLIGRVYDAALHEELWRSFLVELATAVRGEMPGMNLVVNDSPADVIAVDCDSGFLDSYYAHFGRIQVSVKDRIPPDGRVDLDELAPCPMERWEFCADWMRPQGLRHYLGQYLLRPDGLAAGFGVYRERRAGPFERGDGDLMCAVAPHFARAVQLCDHLAALRAERDVAAAALEQLSIGLLLCDERGRLLAANPPAERMAAACDGLCITPTGLSLSHGGAQRELRRLLREAGQTARSEGVGPGGGVLAVPRPSGRRPYELLVTPLPRQGLAVGPHRAAVAVFVSDPELRPPASEEILRHLYGLTPAEARLAVQLARGERLEDSADALGVTIGTARNQLKQIFAKTDTHRQAELVRRILSGPARLGVEAASPSSRT